MIRKLEESDLSRIMQIWLSANKEAHGFIKESYWDENFEAVKAALPCAEIYVHENAEAEPDGFIGLNGEHIEGLFVDKTARNMGIGKELLDLQKQPRAADAQCIYKKLRSCEVLPPRAVFNRLARH